VRVPPRALLNLKASLFLGIGFRLRSNSFRFLHTILVSLFREVRKSLEDPAGVSSDEKQQLLRKETELKLELDK
jgi:hypothetical protein